MKVDLKIVDKHVVEFRTTSGIYGACEIMEYVMDVLTLSIPHDCVNGRIKL